jgi:FkbM family methyltransferase
VSLLNSTKCKWVVKSALNQWGLFDRMQAFRKRLRSLWSSGVESDFEIFKTLADREGLILDVGANAGQSADFFLKTCLRAKIHSFEPNPKMQIHMENLREKWSERFSFSMTGVGATSGELNYFVPEVDGILFTQEGTFAPESLAPGEISYARMMRVAAGRPFKMQSQKISIVSLDSLKLENVSAIKIDVQGFEQQVLDGAQNLLRQQAPLLMIENFDGMIEMMAGLAKFNYGAHRFDSKTKQLVRIQEEHALTGLANLIFI